MEINEIVQPTYSPEIYNYAANLIVYGNKNAYEVKVALLDRGVDEQSADYIIGEIEGQVNTARRKKANKDMLYGALWCGGGLLLTMAHIGFIFWGAIIFGGIQFFRGVTNLKS